MSKVIIDINSLSDDIIPKIFLYLSPNDLLIVSQCCKSWYSFTSLDENIWHQHTIILWSIITVNRPDDLLLLNRIKSLSMTDLKNHLKRVDTSRCIEKLDYQLMLQSYILFHNKKDYYGKYIYHYPLWCSYINQFKASYYYSIKELKRDSINFQELCSIKWKFSFKDYGIDESWNSTFNKDFTLTSELHNQLMSWRFVVDRHDKSLIQVESYPPLTSTRMPDGSWRLDNLYVTFVQVGSIPSNKLPLY